MQKSNRRPEVHRGTRATINRKALRASGKFASVIPLLSSVQFGNARYAAARRPLNRKSPHPDERGETSRLTGSA